MTIQIQSPSCAKSGDITIQLYIISTNIISACQRLYAKLLCVEREPGNEATNKCLIMIKH